MTHSLDSSQDKVERDFNASRSKKTFNATVMTNKFWQWYFVTKIVLNYLRKKCSSDRKILLEFEAGGRELSKILRSLEQFIQKVKGQNNFW